MPTHTQTMVDVKEKSALSALGKANFIRVASSFPASPIHSGEMTDATIKAKFQELALDGPVNDGGHTFGTFNRDYVDAPDLATVETGGGGLPASPYVPNPVSPGPGTMDPTKQGEAPEGFGQEPNSQWGVGDGLASPKTTSEAISRAKLGDYIMANPGTQVSTLGGS